MLCNTTKFNSQVGAGEGCKIFPHSHRPEIWLPNGSVDNLRFAAINVSHGCISLLTRLSGYKTLTWFCCLTSHSSNAISSLTWNLISACLRHLICMFTSHRFFKMNQQEEKKKEKSFTPATTRRGSGWLWLWLSASHKRLYIKCVVVLGGVSPQCSARSRLILCSSACEWLMCPQRKSPAPLMDFHFHESSFQTSAVEGSQSEFEVMPHCVDCSLLGGVLPRSPRVTGIAEMCRRVLRRSVPGRRSQ